MMFCTARARLSVPPPGPAVATNSIGLCGCQAACAGTAPTSMMAAAGSNIRDVTFMVSSGRSSCCRWCLVGSSGDLLGAGARSCDDRAFPFERLDLGRVETMLAQDLACVLAIDRSAGAHHARRRRELDRKPDRLHRPER